MAGEKRTNWENLAGFLPKTIPKLKLFNETKCGRDLIKLFSFVSWLSYFLMAPRRQPWVTFKKKVNLVFFICQIIMKFGLLCLPLSLLLMAAEYWYLCTWKRIYVLFLQVGHRYSSMWCFSRVLWWHKFPIHALLLLAWVRKHRQQYPDINCCSSEQSHKPRHSPLTHLSRRSKKKPCDILPKAEKGLFAGLFSEHF